MMDEMTGMPNNQPNNTMGNNTGTTLSEVYAKAGSFIECGHEFHADLHKAKILNFYEPPAIEETDEEDNVYPLSIKYNKRKTCRIMILRYFFLAIMLLVCIPSDLYTWNSGDKFEYRTGYYANQIFEREVAISGVNTFSINTENCRLYILENTESVSTIGMYVSAARGTTVETPLDGNVQFLNVKSSAGAVM